MKGNSGAQLNFAGDFVEKHCPGAKDQYDWFVAASWKGLVEGVSLPYVELIRQSCYRIEYIPGYSATQLTSTQEFDRLLQLVEYWRSQSVETLGSWKGYLQRLERHVEENDSPRMREGLELASCYSLAPSFNHGDLTLENVLIRPNGEMVLIDPNYSQGLFQSAILDYGKLLQSVHSDYHRVFNSSPGQDPAPLLAWLWEFLEIRGILEESLVAELTHLMRLRKYRPEQERGKVDDLISMVIQEISSLRGG
jgi:thiamine kinase-like enzyme